MEVASWLVLCNSRSLLPARNVEGATLCDELLRAAGRCWSWRAARPPQSTVQDAV